MKCVSVSRLSDDALIRELKESVASDNTHTARQVALIAEVRSRKLYRPAGYESMYAYCVGEFGLSEDAAYKRIQVASAARRCPVVLAALAEGRVHLSGLKVMAKHLTPTNVDELLAAAAHQTKRTIERLVAERFPRADVPASVRAIPQPPQAPTEPSFSHPQVLATPVSALAPAQVGDPANLGQAGSASAPSVADEPARLAPLAPQRYAVQFTLDQAGHDLLQHVQELLGHRVSRSDLAEVVVRALKAYAAQLERKRFAATERPLAPRRSKPGSRHIPAHVKRAVRERDDGRCTFVSDSGHRCEARSNLEYDHVLEYARGGEATVSGIRLRCRAHNQLTAERTFGADFMQHKREQAAGARDLNVRAT